jgi:pyridoxine 4-dehydrogenase
MTDQDSRLDAAAAGRFPLGDDLLVNRLGFGAMRLTGKGVWGEPEDPEEARRVLRRAVKLGVNLIDTADSYGPEVSERLIAEALHPYPEELVIATKGASHALVVDGSQTAAPSTCARLARAA